MYNGEIGNFVNDSGRNSKPIFTKFGTRIAEEIFKAEFVCDRKQKYFARMRSSRISIFAPFFSISRLKTTFFIQSSPYLGTGLD